MDSMTEWLDADQQRSWRAWLTLTQLLPDRLSRELQASHGLTGADYEILVRLSESPERRMRMSELADRTLSSRSRLSHQIDRMVAAGLVERETCLSDGRGANAVLTDTGWTTLVSAAPAHVQYVRENFVDVLTREEFEALGRACAKVAEFLGADAETTAPPPGI
jgi:DNA-binding MarR family transcriptional regulator